MTHSEFLSEALRLKNRYGDKYYPKEVLEVIYTEVGFLSKEWWIKSISTLLAKCKFAPLLPEIQEYSKIEKHNVKKDRIKSYLNKREEEKSQFSDEDVSELLNTVRAVARGSMTVEAVNDYCTMLESAMKPFNTLKCVRCSDTGIFLLKSENANPTAFKCNCQKGLYGKEEYAIYR